MIELPPEQARAMAGLKLPLQVRDPLTEEVLIRQKVYELTCGIVPAPSQAGWDDPADDDLIRIRA